VAQLFLPAYCRKLRHTGVVCWHHVDPAVAAASQVPLWRIRFFSDT
jgi:hypothetical protein